MVENELTSDLVWGRHPVAAALTAGRVNKLWILRGASGLEDVLNAARASRVVFQWVDRQRLDGLTGGAVHQGVAARVSAHEYQTLDDLFSAGRPSPLLLLDGVTDPHNLGAILRNAAFFGARGVVIPRWRSAGMTGAVDKASAGAAGLVPLVQVANIGQTILELKKKDYWVYGADAAGRSCAAFDFAQPVALVIGAEGTGLHRLVRERCDDLIAVPGEAKVPSLNASCASAALLYELYRRRGPDPRSGGGGPLPGSGSGNGGNPR